MKMLALLVPIVLGVTMLVTTTPGSGGTMHTMPAICGSTLMASFTLTADVNCSGSDGLHAGAKNIVINLNGHRLITTNGSNTTGVAISNFDGVAVENGVISGFDQGIAVAGAQHVRVTNVRVENGGTGLVAGNATSLTISGSFFRGAILNGVLIQDSNGATVTGTSVQGAGNNGIWVQNSTGVTLSGIQALNNGAAGIDGQLVTGAMSNNVADGNGSDGIDALWDGTGGGVLPTLVLTGNRAAFNVGLGISGAGVRDGGKNVVQQNGTAVECVGVACVAVSS
jgi:hypothetical protein